MPAPLARWAKPDGFALWHAFSPKSLKEDEAICGRYYKELGPWRPYSRLPFHERLCPECLAAYQSL